MKTNLFILGILVGIIGVKFVEDSVMPRVEHGWNLIDDQRHAYCKQRSRKWYRKATFQVDRTYTRCMRDEI